MWGDNMKQVQLPSKIKELINGKEFTVDDVGMSGNRVLIFADMVLKIEDATPSTFKQLELMQWLQGKLPIPEMLAYEELNGKCYLLMSKIAGQMSCDSYYLEQPHVLLEALACGMKMLWKVDITGCPQNQDLDIVLAEARMRVENGLVDIEDVEPTTFGEGGFESPKHLLDWLEKNQPPVEPVFSHGDFCLPNIFLEDGQVKGFIDLGRAGVADKWKDIALCYRSLKHNYAVL